MTQIYFSFQEVVSLDLMAKLWGDVQNYQLAEKSLPSYLQLCRFKGHHFTLSFYCLIQACNTECVFSCQRQNKLHLYSYTVALFKKN